MREVPCWKYISALCDSRVFAEGLVQVPLCCSIIFLSPCRPGPSAVLPAHGGCLVLGCCGSMSVRWSRPRCWWCAGEEGGLGDRRSCSSSPRTVARQRPVLSNLSGGVGCLLWAGQRRGCRAGSKPAEVAEIRYKRDCLLSEVRYLHGSHAAPAGIDL